MWKGECGGEMRAGVGEEVSKYKNIPVPSSSAAVRFFSEPRIFFVLMTIVDSPLFGHSTIGLNFYDYGD
jgi:hypothetical protein